MPNQNPTLDSLEQQALELLASIRALKTAPTAPITSIDTQPKSGNSPKEPTKPTTISAKATSLPATELGPTPSITAEWPQAVDPKLDVSQKGDAEKRYRAMQICGLIGISFDNKRILDCGCGEGHVTEEMALRAKKVVGYDARIHSRWQNSPTVTFTNQQETAESNGPYDHIVLYDTLDHLLGTDPIHMLTWLRDMLTTDGSMFIRTHPWTARHGGHAYEHINKAFIHLALTSDELSQLDVKPDHNLKIARPMATYEKWFADAGLKITHREIHAEPVEPFFQGDLLERIIKVTWGGKIDKEQAHKIMTNSFIDYMLVRG